MKIKRGKGKLYSKKPAAKPSGGAPGVSAGLASKARTDAGKLK